LCCGLLAALSWSSRVPECLPRLCGGNSTEIVHVPPFAAIVVHVLTVTLNGGVAAGAVVNEIGSGRSLTSVMLWAELTASTDTGSKLNDFCCALIFAGKPFPFTLILCTP